MSILQGPARIEVGELQIDQKRFEVLVHNIPINLTRKEFLLLWTLAAEPERVFNRQELIETAWGPNVAVEHRTIDAHVTRLRKKLKVSSELFISIDTVWGIGYRLKSHGTLPTPSIHLHVNP